MLRIRSGAKVCGKRTLYEEKKEDKVKMAESNRMKEMPVNKLMVQMGIPMILSMALQAVYNIVDSALSETWEREVRRH